MSSISSLSNAELFKELKKYFPNTGPVTETTRSIYERRLFNFRNNTNSLSKLKYSKTLQNIARSSKTIKEEDDDNDCILIGIYPKNKNNASFLLDERKINQKTKFTQRPIRNSNKIISKSMQSISEEKITTPIVSTEMHGTKQKNYIYSILKKRSTLGLITFTIFLYLVMIKMGIL